MKEFLDRLQASLPKGEKADFVFEQINGWCDEQTVVILCANRCCVFYAGSFEGVFDCDQRPFAAGTVFLMSENNVRKVFKVVREGKNPQNVEPVNERTAQELFDDAIATRH